MTDEEIEREYFLMRPGIVALIDSGATFLVWWAGMNTMKGIGEVEALRRADEGSIRWKQGMIAAYKHQLILKLSRRPR